MPQLQISAESKIKRSPRVQQIEAMFDVAASERAKREWSVDLPIEDEDWSVGLIVGPSGSGKSTIAREVWGADNVIRELEWSRERSILDGFPKGQPIKDVIGLLTSVGFGSPPSWLQPYSTLSTGEQFRATVARAIAETQAGETTVIDEFTSTIDRQVAKIASHAVAKSVRRRGSRLVAVTCHYDVVDWLQPDWVYQPHLAKFTRRCLRRRPAVSLDVHPVHRSVWSAFAKHHYLTGELSPTAQCVGGFVDGQCVAFLAWINFPNNEQKQIRKGHRLVVFPDWQGLGIGPAMIDWCGEHHAQQGIELRATIAHYGMIGHHARSPRWRLLRAGAKQLTIGGRGRVGRASRQAYNVSPRNLVTHTFVYVPGAGDDA